jgi:hypothetical protein
MRFGLGLLSLVVLSGCSKACAPGTSAATQPSTYSYLVTPSGGMFRLLKTGPFFGAEHQRLGTMVFYAGTTREIARIEADAEALVAALGPELQAAGERALTVGVNVGYDPQKAFSRAASYNVVFALADGRWIRVLRKPEDSQELAGGGGAANPPDDPSFPYDLAMTQAGATAAANWLALLDSGAQDDALLGMTEAFRSQVTLAPGQWREVLERRKGLSRTRTVLYRMQTRPMNLPTPRSSVVTLEYEAHAEAGARVLERVAMLCEPTGCKTAGYVFQPISGG